MPATYTPNMVGTYWGYVEGAGLGIFLMGKPPRSLSVALLYFPLEGIPRTQSHHILFAGEEGLFDECSQGPVAGDVEVVGNA